jgi:hypothetical protein
VLAQQRHHVVDGLRRVVLEPCGLHDSPSMLPTAGRR